MVERLESSRWWYPIPVALVAGLFLLPFVSVFILGDLEGIIRRDPLIYTILGAVTVISVCLSASLYLDARGAASASDGWHPNPRLYAGGAALYPLSLPVVVWYLCQRYWHVGIAGVPASEPPSIEWLAASRWRYWIALGPILCFVGIGATALPFGILIGMLCWVVGLSLFVLAIHIDVRHVRAAELEWKPGVGRYTYPPVIALSALAIAPIVMSVIGIVYLFQRRRHLKRAIRSGSPTA